MSIPKPIHPQELHDQIVVQDEAFRNFVEGVVFQAEKGDSSAAVALLGEGLAVIHERLGNIFEMLSIRP